VGLIFQNFAINTLTHAGVRLMQEFVFHPSRQGENPHGSP
jgi:hypothetical protein